MHLYKLNEKDPDYEEEVGQKTNIIAMILKDASKKKFGIHLGGIKGKLLFKSLKDVKELVEKYYVSDEEIVQSNYEMEDAKWIIDCKSVTDRLNDEFISILADEHGVSFEFWYTTNNYGICVCKNSLWSSEDGEWFEGEDGAPCSDFRKELYNYCRKQYEEFLTILNRKYKNDESK